MDKASTIYEKIKKGTFSQSLNPEECVELINYIENRLVSENESKYRSLFEMSDDAILVIDDNTFVDCNQAVVKMLGYKNKAELLNTHPSELSPEKQPDGRLSYEKAQEMMMLALQNGSHHFEWTHTRANGENFPVEVWLSKIEYGDKVLINTIWRDLTEKKRAEQIILKNIEEKEILLKEIHHRVKNNLQVITSLLNLQANNVEEEQVKAILFQSKARIESMSKVHEMLYNSINLSSINYGDYLRELLDKLLLNTKGESNLIDINIGVKNLFLNINTAIPLGLLINEIVTNSLKYAFPSNAVGSIYINIVQVNKKQLELNIGDDGIGYPSDINFEVSHSLGFQLVKSLTEQLNGTITRDLSKKGTHYKLLFEQL